MFKKTLISVAVASSLGLSGCFDSGDSGANANPDYRINNPAIDGKTWPIFNPVTSQLPIPNDLIFDSEQGDGTFGVSDTSPPVTTALNELSGASTVAPAVIQFNGQIDANTVVYGQTVFLIELEYASGDPVQGLGNQEPPTVAGLATARADVESLSGTSAIRILPLEPLKPRKRYVAVVTKGVTDINGDAIISSPSYANLTDEEQPLGSSTLAPVRALINNLWEATAAGFFQAAGAPLTADDIAISYSFTTSNDEKVLQYIAEPAAWFSDQIETFVKVSAASQAVEAGASSYADVKTAVDTAFNAFPTSLPANPDSPLNALFAPGGACEVGGANVSSLGEPAVNCVGVALASNFATELPTPLPGVNRNVFDGSGFTDTISIDNGTISPVGLVSAVAGSIPGSENVLAVQGTVSLPYYLGNTGPGIAGSSAVNWTADNELAASLNETFSALGVSLPQADPSVSTAVNYIFPFPKELSTQEVPLLALYPNSGAINGVVLYQHGITTDRSAALTFGTGLAAEGFVVIAIDQPLHGVTPFAAEDQSPLAIALLTGGGLSAEQAEALAPLVVAGNVSDLADALAGGTATPGTTATAQSLVNTVANAGSTIPGLAPADNERHFGLYSDASGAPAAMVFDPASPAGTDGSGSFYINLQNFLAARDNNRQSAVDQMNLRATLFGNPTAGKAGVTLERPAAAGGDDTPINVTAADTVYFAGHSLGTITGMPFVASVNENQIGSTIFTAADGSSDIPSTFNDVASASMLTPGGGIVRLLENSPTFAPRILLGLQQAAGLTQGDANLETYFNVLQATIDSADPINFVDTLGVSTPVLLSEVAGDTVIPNAADEQQWGIPALSGTFSPEQTELPVSVTVNSFNAPLAGTKPLTLGLDMLTTYNEGNHGTPTSADNIAVFGGMLCETYVTFGVALADLPALCSAP
ncbi:hypothetical protein [Marinobacter arenosus]|uniref:hypothetical protein n=1 Tax=Marinobacter arenosus TaxID=2856822 RepID=UPI001C4AED64|nr:hypothetical protein [Marinobacter arenosus]MBW0149145.1 hypothetical protein [Marinobacter arenosus]